MFVLVFWIIEDDTKKSFWDLLTFRKTIGDSFWSLAKVVLWFECPVWNSTFRRFLRMVSKKGRIIWQYEHFLPFTQARRNSLKFVWNSNFKAFNVIINVRFMSYSKCSNWHLMSKLWSNFGYLFTFYCLDGANSTDLHICSLWTGQFIS